MAGLEKDYRRQINTACAARGASGGQEEIFIKFYRRAVREDNYLIRTAIIADAAFCWNMFEDEVRDYLNRQISSIKREL